MPCVENTYVRCRNRYFPAAFTMPTASLSYASCSRRMQEGDKAQIRLLPELEQQSPVSTGAVSGLYVDKRADGAVRGRKPFCSAKSLLRLPPLHTILHDGKRAEARRVPKSLSRVKCTEIGTLELYCVSKEAESLATSSSTFAMSCGNRTLKMMEKQKMPTR